MDEAHFGLPLEDWDDPAPPERPNARLVLPGNECEYTVVRIDGGVPIVTTPGETPSDAPAAAGADEQVEQGAPVTTAAPGGTTAVTTAPVQTTPRVVVTAVKDIGTTIAPNILDPNHPLPSVETGRQITTCR
jgi:penicillin-binding protein 1A